MDAGELQMRDGWSDYHRAWLEGEIERLEKKLALLKHEIAAHNKKSVGQNALESARIC